MNESPKIGEFYNHPILGRWDLPEDVETWLESLPDKQKWWLAQCLLINNKCSTVEKVEFLMRPSKKDQDNYIPEPKNHE
ncbi:hypothetical protein [Pseudanabaena sp. 'Roaring Creek']|uniref:hypothetical protein n=1 Tax=Pseudanabaena sp. 'Roaring Creek' TaxID=1681830 RepID=UPI0006D8135B|nr:hypothetical protein [Pseudanabaena sp. 'Roaring Creek']